jgi:hypothetical protein
MLSFHSVIMSLISMPFLTSPFKVGFVLLSTTLLLSGCNGSGSVSTTASPDTSPSIATSPPPNSPSASANPDAATAAAQNPTISDKGVGAAQLGMTLGDLKQAMGETATFTEKSPFMVDFDAIEVGQDGEVQFYLLYLAKQPLQDSDLIQGILTRNPKFQTPEGVGAGISIAQAEQVYGKATLSYNTQNESREYARFERQPAPNISFATGNGNQQPAGVYPAATTEYNETGQFRPDAKIQSVLVVCLTDACSAPADSASGQP